MRQLKITKQITNRDSKSLEKYLQEVSKQPMVTPEEEVELAKKIKEGDEDALQKLVNANLRFVISTAKQYQHQGIRLEDLIDDGNIGLIEAAKRFDETKGFKFISYAVWWIRQSILKAISEQSRMVRVPSNKLNDMRKIAHAAAEIEQQHEREATDEEIADMLDINSENVAKALAFSNKHISMDAPIGGDEDGNSTMLNVMEDENTPDPTEKLINESLNKEIQIALENVSDRDAKIVSLYFGLNGEEPKTLDEISNQFGLSRARVRQIKEKTLHRLRKSTNIDKLQAYL